MGIGQAVLLHKAAPLNIVLLTLLILKPQMILILVTIMLAVTVHCLPVKLITTDEKRIDKGYLNQFKGPVRPERITKCVFEERVEFYCPYYWAEERPPYPKNDNVNLYSNCCGDKCCKKDEKEKYDEEMKNKKGWCYEWLSTLGLC